MNALSRPKPATAIYSATHFAVDLCCAAAMFRSAHEGGGALLLLLYNFCAFAMQLPIGALCDGLGHGPAFAALGCAMVGGAGLLGGWPLLMAAVTGLGNGAFHIGAGAEVLRYSRGRAALLGIFVSPGAIGIFLGSAYGADMPGLSLAVAALMLLCAAAILLTQGRGASAPPLDPPRLDKALLALLLVVCMRSYCGAIISFPWKAAYGWAALSGVVLGKALGGLACDRLGPRRASLVSLGLCAPLFLLAENSPIAGVLAILLFNMTMPITLWGAAKLLGGHGGFAFGLLTFGLFMGLCPAYFGFGWAGGWTCALLSLASLALLPGLPKEDALCE